MATLSSMLFFLNPLVINNSTIWGQMDSITTGLFVLALYCLHKKHFTIALIAAIFSLFVKLSLIFLLPILVVCILVSSKSLATTLKSIAVAFALILVAVLPLSSSPLVWLFQYLSLHATGEMQNITAFAFNLWWFFFTPVLSIVSTNSVFEFSEIRLLGSPLVSQTFLSIPLWVYAASSFFISLIPYL